MIRIEFNDAPARRALARLAEHLGDMTPAMQEIGEMMIAATQDRIARGISPDGAAFAPRSPVTLARYAAQGLSFGAPLNVSGMLRGGIAADPGSSQVEVGPNAIQAAVMQFGAPRHSLGPVSPWGDIPARPFLGVSEADSAGIVAIVEEWLEGALDGA